MWVIFTDLNCGTRRGRPAARRAPRLAGYRDVAIYLRFRRMGPTSHVCELQLQLLSFARIKSDYGHRRYVAWRNAMGT